MDRYSYFFLHGVTMPSLSYDFDTNTNISLESQMQRLALEAGVLDNVIDTFRNVIPNLANKINNVKDTFTTDDDTTAELRIIKTNYGALKPKLQHASYVNYNKTLVSVPEGFKGDLLEYVISLTEMANEIFQEANKTLGEYNFALSSFITNKESKISLKDHTDLFHGIQRRRVALTGRISVYFPDNNVLSKAYLKDTLKRFADLEVLVKAADSLNNDRKKQNLKELTQLVAKSTDLLDIIVKNTETEGTSQVSGNAAMNISQGAYELGKFVEFVAVYRFRVVQAISSVKALVEQLNNIV